MTIASLGNDNVNDDNEHGYWDSGDDNDDYFNDGRMKYCAGVSFKHFEKKNCIISFPNTSSLDNELSSA